MACRLHTSSSRLLVQKSTIGMRMMSSKLNKYLYASNIHKHVPVMLHQHHYHSTSFLEASKENLSVAIVGTGPSGCYTAKYLLSTIKQLQSKSKQQTQKMDAADINATVMNLKYVDIDMIDKLPTPFGLVRSGVAPDHPEVKNVENDFAKLFNVNSKNIQNDVNDTIPDEDDSDGIQSSMEFRGNVTVGKDISLHELQNLYDIVVLAYGCESDRKLGLEGEDLQGVFSAREFVAWYNGHPDFEHMGSEFQHVLDDPNGTGVEVVVIGQGNVALDCARVLAKGRQGLVDTDITSRALDVIGDGVKCTSVLGRRGHVQGAFTIKELRELTKLDDVSFVINEKELDAGLTDASVEELNGPRSRPKVRIDKLLRDTASKPIEKREKEIRVRFLLNPVKFKSSDGNSSRLGSVICERTELEGEAGQQRAVGTGVMEEIRASIALVSIGYRGLQIPGLDDSLFDQTRGIVKNVHGKVADNLYVCGWLKRGPTGIIGTNLVDAKDTISSVLKDLNDLPSDNSEGRIGLDNLLTKRDTKFVDWSSYQNIDAAEKDSSRLRSKDQPREKFTNKDEMISFLK